MDGAVTQSIDAGSMRRSIKSASMTVRWRPK